MLPKVTLLSGEGTNFLLRFGSKSFDFQPGVEELVPVAVALALKGYKMPGGKPLFNIDDMPEIVVQARMESQPAEARQDVDPRQLRF